VDDELKDVTSVLFELICICGDYITFHFDKNIIHTFIDCICWQWFIFCFCAAFAQFHNTYILQNSTATQWWGWTHTTQVSSRIWVSHYTSYWRHHNNGHLAKTASVFQQ